MAGQRPYHHGDLRRAILDAAIEVISAEGTGSLSLRELARRAGVSHAAPAHHFKDKAGLLTAIAIEGNELLAESLADALATDPVDLPELGARYVRFAIERPAHFEVMFRPELYHRDDPEFVAAAHRSEQLLRAGIKAAADELGGTGQSLAALGAWSLAHGFATLWRGENLEFNELTESRDPVELFRALARSMTFI